jgi:hypothetical protein
LADAKLASAIDVAPSGISRGFAVASIAVHLGVSEVDGCAYDYRKRVCKIDLGGGGMLFLPGLNEAKRKILNAYGSGWGLQIMHVTPTNFPVQAFTWRPGAPNCSHWWWLFPAKTLCSLVEAGGFKIIATSPGWKGRAVSVLCQK